MLDTIISLLTKLVVYGLPSTLVLLIITNIIGVTTINWWVLILFFVLLIGLAIKILAVLGNPSNDNY